MHRAPSVSYPVGRSRLLGLILSLAWLLGALATGLWTLYSPSWRPAIGWAAVAATGAFAAWRWWHGASGVLAWDGEAWQWPGGPHAQSGTLEVTVDLQDWLLLRWRSDGRSCWLWLERAARPERWDDLRRGVYSRARIEALPAAGPPAAKP